MNKTTALVFFGIALISQVLSAPQFLVEVSVNVNGTKIGDTAQIIVNQNPEIPTTKSPEPIINGGLQPGNFQPVQPVAVIGSWVQGAGQTIRNIPGSIALVLNSFTNNVRNGVRRVHLFVRNANFAVFGLSPRPVSNATIFAIPPLVSNLNK